ncbi:MAG: CHAT domain-containing protein [Saprospiraceae bacterium]
MKKTLCVVLLLCYVFSGFGQVVDTAAVVREVDSLLKIANTQMRSGKLEDALKNAQTANEQTETVLGKDNLRYADCQHQIGATLNDMGKLQLAEEPLLTGLELRKRYLGPDHLIVSTSLNALGTLYARLRRYDEAETVLLDAKRINARQYGVRHFNYVMGLQNLGGIYRNTGRHEEAEKIFTEALSVLKDTLGESHPLYAMVSMNLGLSLYERGEYQEAEVVMVNALHNFEKTTPRNEPRYFLFILNLAVLYETMGRYEAALELCSKGKEVSKKAFGENDYTLGQLATTAGFCYKARGELDKAATEFLLSKELMLIHFGDKHQRYAQALTNLAVLYEVQEKHSEALAMFEEAALIYQAASMEDVRDFAVIRMGKGRCYAALQEYDQAEAELLGAFEILKNAGSESLDEYKTVVQELTKLYQLKQALPEMENFLINFAELTDHNFAKASRYFSEQDMVAYQSLYQQHLNHFYSAAAHFPDISINRQAYDLALLMKNFLMEGKLRLQKAMDNASENTTAVYRKWLGLQRRLAKEYASPTAQQTDREKLESAANALEKELTRTVAGFAESNRQVTWPEVQAALQPGEAALEFIHFNYYTPDATDSVLYAALLLKPGMDQPLFIPLFEEKQLKALLPAGGDKLNSDQVNELYGNSALYDLVWSSVEPHLEGVHTVYYSPGGLLHRLNLSALPAGGQTTLADRYDIVTLGSTRQLVVGNKPDARFSSTALVYGGIQFETDNKSNTNTAPTRTTTGNRGSLDFSAVDSTLRSLPVYEGGWDYLKGSEKEADNIKSVLAKAGYAATVYKGLQASEESFKKIGQGEPSPRILHVSTHGYFFPDPQTVTDRRRTVDGAEPVFKLSDHPMIRSGLILAGANHAWKTGKPLGNREDGVLTAYEISQLDLRNTELVVLSACETGLGQIEGNEGVYGLQRAFKIAGAKHLIMSLWNVRDQQTQELMTYFYQKLLIEKMPVRQALRAAQAEMRRQRYEPFYWAGFVVVE